jgi:hypothetical protein
LIFEAFLLTHTTNQIQTLNLFFVDLWSLSPDYYSKRVLKQTK